MESLFTAIVFGKFRPLFMWKNSLLLISIGLFVSLFGILNSGLQNCRITIRVGRRSKRSIMANGRRRSKREHRPPSNETKPPAIGDRPEIKRPPPSKSNPHPWLLFSHDKGFKRQTFCSTAGETHLRSIPELRNNIVIACCDDWLVLSSSAKNTHHNYSLLNILTFESISLPPFRSSNCRDFETGSCILSSPPHTANSMVLLFETNRPIISFFPLGLGNVEWTEMKFGKEHTTIDIDGFGTTACCNGVIYAAVRNWHLLFRLDIDELNSNKLVLVSLDIRLPYYGGILTLPIHTSLVAAGEELFAISIYLGGVRSKEVLFIEVHKLILPTKEWVRVDSLKDQVFFLGSAYNVSCPARCEMVGSRIYFTRFEDRKVYSYNIEDRNLSIAFHYPILSLPRSTPDWWLVQRHQSLDYQIDNEEICQKEERMAAKINNEEIGMEEDSKQLNLLDLPPELLEKIAGSLVLLDYMCFRSVCQRFLLAAPAIQWKEELVRGHHLSPMLIFTGKDRKVFNLINPDKNGGTYFKRIPTELEDAIINHSWDGWLLMTRNRDHMLFFFNPFTKVVIPLPECEYHIYFGFTFLSVPTSSNWLVVGIWYVDKGIGLSVIGPGGEEWDYIVLDGPNFVPNHCAPVFWNDSFYIMSQEGNLGVLTAGTSYNWKVLDKLKAPCNSFYQCFVVQSAEELLSIFVGDFGSWVKVFRLEIPALAWEEVNSLGTYTVFLSRSSAFSMVAKYKEMGNRIYFPRLHKEKPVFYSLETRKFRYSSCGEDSLMDYVDTVEQLQCCWIEPRWP